MCLCLDGANAHARIAIETCAPFAKTTVGDKISVAEQPAAGIRSRRDTFDPNASYLVLDENHGTVNER
jgi:hypothetical protein